MKPCTQDQDQTQNKRCVGFSTFDAPNHGLIRKQRNNPNSRKKPTHRKLVRGDNANGGNRGRDGRANRIRVERRKLVNHKNDQRKRVADGGADHDAIDEQRKDAGNEREEERNHDRNGDGICAAD